jgi:HK97 family phage portal protein
MKIGPIEISFKREKQKTVSTSWLCSADAYTILCSQGYTPLNKHPDVRKAVDRIANLISSMTIHLVENTPNGDKRVKDGLARMVDVTPSLYMTKKNWLYTIVRSMLLDGDGNAVVMPTFDRDGLLTDMAILEPFRYSFRAVNGGYVIVVDGKACDPNDFLHFVWNPDPETPFWGSGARMLVSDAVKNINQAAATTRDFLNNPRPALVVSMDTTVEEIQDMPGRELLWQRFVKTTDTGGALIIPGDIAKIEQLKPQSLADLAIADSVKIDRQSIADLFGVPQYFVSVGPYNRGEFNNFVMTQLSHYAKLIDQELTKKLLLSPGRYFRFNPLALLDYSVTEKANIATRLRPAGIITGNEARDLLGLDPSDAPGMDEHLILENYIPVGASGDQDKLKGGVDAGTAGNTAV